MSYSEVFKSISELITALSGFAWPATALILLCVYKKPLSELIEKIKELEAFGIKSKHGSDIDEFKKNVEEASGAVAELAESNPGNSGETKSETSELPADTAVDPNIIEQSEHEWIRARRTLNAQRDVATSEILADANGSPEFAIIRLSNVIENEARTILASMGFLKSQEVRKGIGIGKVLHELKVRRLVPNSVIKSMEQFVELRNQIIHGKDRFDDKEVTRVLDVGLTLLNSVRQIPHEVHTVIATFEVFEDEECTKRREGIEGILIQSTTPDGGFLVRAFNTSWTTYYSPGVRVTWEWDMETDLGRSFYRNENNGKVFTINSLDFNGQILG